jgi:hypothetical protein
VCVDKNMHTKMVSMADDRGCTPLHLAAKNARLMEILLPHVNNLGRIDVYGCSKAEEAKPGAFLTARQKKQLEEKRKNTPTGVLHMAAAAGNVEGVRLIIATLKAQHEGPDLLDLTAKDRAGRTAVILAGTGGGVLEQ